jgi:hypothetical protein
MQHKRIARKVDCMYSPTSRFSLIPMQVGHLNGIFVSARRRAFQWYVVSLGLSVEAFLHQTLPVTPPLTISEVALLHHPPFQDSNAS